jgi:hypothetical protein
MRVYKRDVKGPVGRWFARRNWGGCCIVLPFFCLILLWASPPEWVLRHELAHAAQAARYGFLGWWVRYLWGLRKGYWNNPLEVAAREHE